MRDGELDDRLRDRRHRDVDGDIGAEHLGELALRVDLRVELELVEVSTICETSWPILPVAPTTATLVVIRQI